MKLFDLISPIYGLFFNYQVKHYEQVLYLAAYEGVDLKKCESVLDIGCGTGALYKALHERGIKVTGVEVSKGMLSQARRKLADIEAECVEIRAGEPLPFADRSFDLVITSYVAHGLEKNERLVFYREMQRLAKKMVIVHDYNDKRELLTTIIEWLEGGDYFNFIKQAAGELEEFFGNIRILTVGKRAAWYICEVGGELDERFPDKGLRDKEPDGELGAE